MEEQAYRTYEEYQDIANFFTKMYHETNNKEKWLYHERWIIWQRRADKAFRIYLGFWNY